MARERDALQERLLGLFVQELDDGLRTLTEGLLQLEAQETAAADVGELFRSAHGLKGAAHAVGIADVVAICDRMESTFAAVREGELAVDAGVVADLLADVDALDTVAAGLRDRDPGGAAQPHRFRPAEQEPMPPAPAVPVAADHNHPPAAADPTAASPSAPQLARVAVDKVDALLTAAGEGLASAQRLAKLSSDVDQVGESLEAGRRRWRAIRGSLDAQPQAEIRQLDDLVEEASARAAALQRTVAAVRRDVSQAVNAVADGAQNLRLQPLADAFQGLDRVVRDLAAASGKRARLLIDAGTVEVDRAVVAELRDPLLHLVRNAVDHGVEPPDQRVANGKPPVASIHAAAELRDNAATIVISDDGGGVDREALLAAAQRRGIAELTDSLEAAFAPGVSTAPTVTAVSGRGVGLDAVRFRLEQIGGAVDMASEPGAGTTITMIVPTTLTTMRVLLTEAAGEIVALPVLALERVTTVDAEDLREAEGRLSANISGGNRHLVSLAGALGLEITDAPPAQLHVALLRAGMTALVVDRFLADADVVVRPVPRRLQGMVGALGVAVLAQGQAAHVLNPSALVRAPLPAVPSHRPAAAPPRARRILLAEDTATTRALERSILDAAGYDVVTAVDGLQAWQLLQSEEVDLVVSDVHMPGMDGLALCEAIRGAPSLRDLPVVLVTSLASDRDRQRGADAGADAYFVKSEFQQGTLLDAIQRLL